jgi:tryptophanase/pimeloyl-ACP methyl ester carboxylesterase
VLDRDLDPTISFADNGFTSFDMLRSVSTLERRLGALRKTLLFDHPTLGDLADHLAAEYSEATLVDRLTARDAPVRSDGPVVLAPATADGDVPVIARKRELPPELAALMATIDAAHAKEGGLAGRDIAPLVFVGSRRTAYLNFSRRDDNVFAWSYAGSEDDFAEVAGEYLTYAKEHGLRASFLSLLPLPEAGGIPLLATPFGAVQRLTDLAGFTLAGGRMIRLRQMVHKFGKAGRCETTEYAVGSDPATDREISDMIGRWGDGKQMVNPYVAVVRAELERGVLADRHRMFLTRVDGDLVNVVIVTRIPSEPGWLLDLEFYPRKAPRGGLEYAICEILARLRDEGATVFSFGASFGVTICESPTADPVVLAALEELHSGGIFGAGNFQFKNKFRPTNVPIYLCQPAEGERTAVPDVILMIANPDIGAGVPGMKATTREPVPGDRVSALAAAGYNPLALPARAIGHDLLTDSWAEWDHPVVATRENELTGTRAEIGADWLPFDLVVPTGSGRAAEALLCRSWPAPSTVVIHNGLFSSWLVNLADATFDAKAVPTTGRGTFAGDLDIAALRERLAVENGAVAFVCVELSGNAGGGHPVSLANLRAVRDAAAVRRVPLVLDATRVVENAVFVATHEHPGAGVWDVVRDLLDLADVVTMSLSKDFGLASGGLLATRHPALAARLRDQLALRGAQVGLRERRRMAAALADRDWVERAVRDRMAAVAAVHTALAGAGAPVGTVPGGHCVVLDVDAVPTFLGLEHPVESCLAWIYAGTGVRAAPHLGPGRRIRLAVPVGLPLDDAQSLGAALAGLWREPGRVPDLIPVPTTGGTPARFHPAEALPEDVEQAMREGHRPTDDNAAVLRGVATRTVLSTDSGDVEVFSAGDGPVVLLMHPFNIGAGVFAHQFAALARRYRVVTVHHPGVGATTAAADLTLDGLAGLYRDVLDREGHRGPVAVVGASFGGLVAQSYALRHPTETAALALIGSSYKVGNRNGEVNRLSVVAREDFDRVVGNGGRLTVDRQELERTLLRCESMDPQLGLRYLDVFAAEPTLLARLPEIAVPTLIVQGRHDTVIPRKTAHLLHGAIPDASYVELSGAGHFPTLSHPDEVHAALVPFLAAHLPAVTPTTP